MARPVVAVLGTGSAGMHHLDALRALGTCEPVAISLRPERRTELQASGFSTAANLEEAVRRGAAACVIATDTARHVADAEAAVALGLDFLVEKPAAADAAAARALLGTAAKSGRKGFVACVLRFSDSLARFRELLPRIGALHSVRVECRSYLPDWRPGRPYRESYSARAAEGGVLRDLVHEIDYAGWIFGWPDAVDGRLGNTGRLGIASEEWAELRWKTKAAESVTMSLDYLTRAPRRGIVAHGESGTLQWNCLDRSTTLTPARGAPESASSEQTDRDLFESQSRAFLAALAGTADPRLAPLSDGVRALAVCDAARAASISLHLESIHPL